MMVSDKIRFNPQVLMNPVGKVSATPPIIRYFYVFSL